PDPRVPPGVLLSNPVADHEGRAGGDARHGLRRPAGVAGKRPSDRRRAAEELMLSQIIAVTGGNIRSIPARLGSPTVAVVGIAGVVLVFVAVLSIAEGVKATMKASGDPNLAL